jgi:hypothetical protein
MKRTILLMLLIAAVLPLAAAQTPTPEPRTISRVGQDEITDEAFLTRLRYERFMLGISARIQYSYFLTAGIAREEIPAQLDFVFANPGLENPLLILKEQEPGVTHAGEVLTQMEQELFLQQAASARHIIATRGEADAAIDSYYEEIGVPAGDIETLKSGIFSFSTITEDGLRDIFRSRVLREKLVESITTDPESPYFVAPEETWVEVRHLLIAFPAGETVRPGDANSYFERVEEIADEIQDGLPFEEAVRQYSEDAATKEIGGLLESQPTTVYVDGFREAVETQIIGEVGAPVRTILGYHLILVEAREQRPLEEADLAPRRERAFERWLETEMPRARVNRSERWESFVPTFEDYTPLLGSILPLPTPTPTASR